MGWPSSEYVFLEDSQQILAVTVFGQGLRECLELLGVDPALAEGDFFRAGYFEALTVFQGGYELAGIEQGFVGAGVEPGVAPAHDLYIESALFEIQAVQIGDFELAARRRFEGLGQFNHLLVVKIEPGNGVVGLGLLGFFFQRQYRAPRIELSHAVAFGVVHVVGEHAGAVGAGHGVSQQVVKVVAVEDVVAQYQRRGVVADEFLADQEGLRQTIRAWLDGVLQVQAPLAAVAQQLLETRRVLRRADDEHVANARQHQGAERVVDHGLVEHRQQLLADGERGRVQASAGTAGEDDAFAGHAFRPV